MSAVINHTPFLTRAFSLAEHAFSQGNRPFGALLVIANKIVLETENSVISANDITAHAEMNLLRRLWQQFNEGLLSQATLYSSTEPCLMCAGAILNTPIRHVVYGCGARCLHELAQQSSLSLTGRDVLLSSGSSMLVEGPLLESEALDVHKQHPWW